MIQLIQTQIADSASNIADCEEAGQPKKRIHMADRGFESYSLVATLIMMEQLFLIRGRDITSNGIARSVPKQDSPTFDIDWEITLTVRHTKETQQYHPEKYKILSKTQWKYKLEELKEYHLKLRVVRVEIAPGKYEVILTNLDRKEFPPEVLKELYGLRWNLEVAFRKLKYQVGLSFFHHKKLDFIEMELTARMIFYNFCGAVFMKLNTGIPEGRQLDFAYLVSQLRKYIQEGGTRGAYFEKKIVKNTIPVRPDRKFKRNVRAQSFIFFTNRG